ncbi:MAG TPA: hypothetical protein PK821_05900 [Victivallales bacterium]|nr:hypothetical protein [Victivallales bacterium]
MKNDNTRPRCPGQDMRFWKPEDIFIMKCLDCGNEIEFWKDEAFLCCRKCGKENKNPRIDLGCAKWCKFADQCLGRSADAEFASPIIEKVKALLSSNFILDASDLKELEKACKMADQVLGGTNCDPCVVKTSLVVLFFSAQGRKYSGAMSEILDKAGISSSQQEKISAIVKAIIEGSPSDTEDFKVVKEILGNR